jgi:DNA-binding NtrC family response regulator
VENLAQSPADAPKFLNVLLVEDDDTDARIIGLIADMVEGFDLGVTRVNTLTAATTALQQDKFDLCLLDFWLGRESSLRFLSALEEMDSRMGTVVLSNISPDEATKFRLGKGRNYFLAKAECMPHQLRTAIEAVVAHSD